VTDNRKYYRAGGYRLFDFMVIGTIVICLFVIGLAGAMVIRPIKVSNICETTDNTTHIGVLGMLRMARTGFNKNNKNLEHYYPDMGVGPQESSRPSLE
jgi:hypothetical protein